MRTLLLAACFAGGCLTKGGNIPPPEPDEVVDTWTAAVGGWAFYRAAFRQDGTGLIGVTYHDDPPMIYRITSWKLTEKLDIEDGEPDRLRELLIEVEAVGVERPLQLKGWAGQRHLRLHFSWKDWSPRWVHLYRESALDRRAEDTRAAMDGEAEAGTQGHDTGTADVQHGDNE